MIGLATAVAIVVGTVVERETAVDLLVGVPDPVGRLVIDTELSFGKLGRAWADSRDRLFAHLDANGDGILTQSEAAKAPSALRIRQLGWGYLFAVPASPPWAELDENADGRVTSNEFAAYFRKNGIGPPQVSVGNAPSAETLNAALRKLLHTDAAWRDAANVLQKLDADEDELVRADELVPRAMYPGTPGGTLLTEAMPPKLANFPLRRRVAATDLAVTGVTLNPDRPDLPTTVANFGEIRLVAYSVPGKLLDDLSTAHKTAEERFAAADANRDDVLTRAEMETVSYAPLRDHFDAADRDSNGKLARTEWASYLEVRSRLAATQVTIVAFNHGRGLFEFLDADGDGGLSVRELRTARTRLIAAGILVGGKVDEQKLPRAVRIAASHGVPRTLKQPSIRPGPEWFRAMDRNGDGDLSRREFAGPVDAFNKLDVDEDDLLSAEEVSKKSK